MSTDKTDTACDKTPIPYRGKQQMTRSSGMTPSIITTINNTSPTPPTNSNINNNNTNTISRNKRITEPYYESYIEDSFVGHWEREDDDPDDDAKTGQTSNDGNNSDDDSALHPSTIEFDFDSFGPESFIYTPTQGKSAVQVEKTPVVEKNDNIPVVEDTEHQQPIQDLPTTSEVVNLHHQSAIDSNIQIEHIIDESKIDLKVIEPYKKVISHAGYCHHFDPSAPEPKAGEPAPAVIVFSACYLPDRSRRDYNYVMDHLFLYVLSSLHELIADDYILIYLHNAQPSTMISSLSSRIISNGSIPSSTSDDSQSQNNLPTFSWMKRCYQMIDRRLRKNLKILYLVKPTFWLKTIVIMCKPFISTKFSKKLRFVENMDGLKKCLPVDKLILPTSIENI